MSSLVEQLAGKSDDEVVKALQRKMLQHGNQEATQYLKSIDPARADTIRWKLVASLESIGNKKKKAPAPKKVAAPAPAPVAKKEETKKKRGLVIGDGRYQMGEVLGKGGFARVFKALDLQTGQTVAVKEIQKDLLSKSELPKILKEGEILAQLSHTNIVKFHQLIMEKKQLYFVMEYVSGGSLYHTMKRFGLFPESLVGVYTAQTLLALEYLHAQNVLHRDIKGANLLVDGDGRIKVADFGACTYAQLDKRLTVIGTPFWMAPEIIEMTSGSTKADLWSLGCTVVELLTGSPPYYTLGSMQALFRMVDDAHPPLPANASALCKAFLLQCFEKNPVKRLDATQLLGHEWIRSHTLGKNSVGISPDQMQMTLRQHNATKKTGLSQIDWQQQSAEVDVLHKQAKQLQETGSSKEALERRLKHHLKEKDKLAAQLADQRATLEALTQEVLALKSQKATLQLAKR